MKHIKIVPKAIFFESDIYEDESDIYDDEEKNKANEILKKIQTQAINSYFSVLQQYSSLLGESRLIQSIYQRCLDFLPKYKINMEADIKNRLQACVESLKVKISNYFSVLPVDYQQFEEECIKGGGQLFNSANNSWILSFKKMYSDASAEAGWYWSKKNYIWSMVEKIGLSIQISLHKDIDNILLEEWKNFAKMVEEYVNNSTKTLDFSIKKEE